MTVNFEQVPAHKWEVGKQQNLCFLLNRICIGLGVVAGTTMLELSRLIGLMGNELM